MKYLIDTNIVIEYLRGNQEVISTINELLSDGLAISAISLAELYHGANKSIRPRKTIFKIEAFTSIPEIEVLTVNKDTARTYGKLMAGLEQKGMKLAGIDVLIAATAKFNQLTILTTDKKHFVRLENFGIKIKLL